MIFIRLSFYVIKTIMFKHIIFSLVIIWWETPMFYFFSLFNSLFFGSRSYSITLSLLYLIIFFTLLNLFSISQDFTNSSHLASFFSKMLWTLNMIIFNVFYHWKIDWVLYHKRVGDKRFSLIWDWLQSKEKRFVNSSSKIG